MSEQRVEGLPRHLVCNRSTNVVASRHSFEVPRVAATPVKAGDPTRTRQVSIVAGVVDGQADGDRAVLQLVRQSVRPVGAFLCVEPVRVPVRVYGLSPRPAFVRGTYRNLRPEAISERSCRSSLANEEQRVPVAPPPFGVHSTPAASRVKFGAALDRADRRKGDRISRCAMSLPARIVGVAPSSRVGWIGAPDHGTWELSLYPAHGEQRVAVPVPAVVVPCAPASCTYRFRTPLDRTSTLNHVDTSRVVPAVPPLIGYIAQGGPHCPHGEQRLRPDEPRVVFGVMLAEAEGQVGLSRVSVSAARVVDTRQVPGTGSGLEHLGQIDTPQASQVQKSHPAPSQSKHCAGQVHLAMSNLLSGSASPRPCLRCGGIYLSSVPVRCAP
jgi:hypothetical protein